MLGRNLVTCVSVAATLGGCLAPADDFSDRLANGNDAYQRSLINDIVVNIIRSGYSETTSFVGAGKFSAAHNWTFGLALPTLGVGGTNPPSASFSGNNLQNSIQSSIDATTLNTRKFQNGFNSKISYKQFKSFIDRGYSREFLFYLFVDHVRIRDKASGREYLYRNDPSLDFSERCENFNYTGFVDRSFRRGDDDGPYSPAKNLDGCEYHHFQYWASEFMKYGYNIDYPAARSTQKGAPDLDSAGSKDRSKPQADVPETTPRICYDLALMSPSVQNYLLHYNASYKINMKAESPICGSRIIGNRAEQALIFASGASNSEIFVAIDFRTPAKIFAYLGNMIADGTYNQTILFDKLSLRSLDTRIFALDRNVTKGCYALISYAGAPYCVPWSSASSRAAIAILATLVQENIDRDDVPTNTLSVRVTP